MKHFFYTVIHSIVGICFCVITAKAQEWDMSPQPPDAATFSTYGTYPVSYYTGSPSISIPLFTIDEGEVQVPINLSYSGGGVKVATESSWVGLGWNLYPGGSISRMVVGSQYDNHDTEKYNILFNQWDEGDEADYLRRRNWEDSNPVTPPSIGFWGEIIGDIYDIGNFGDYHNIAGANMDFFTSWASSAALFQPDIYMFNFLGYSGKFYINPETGSIVIIDKKDHIIFKRDAANWDPEVDGWMAILPNGLTVYFQDIEKVHQPYVGQGCTSSNTPSLTWKITKIKLKNGDEIDFTYVNTTYETASISEYDVHSFEDDADYFINYTKHHYGEFGVPGFTPIYCEDNGKPVTVVNELKTLSQIISAKYTVDFNILAGEAKPMLASIEITENHDASFKIGYSFDLEPFSCVDGDWNEWRNSEGVTQQFGAVENFVKHKLTRLQKYTSNNGVKTDFDNPHTFEYNEDIGLPSILSFAQDYWGYYNGQHENKGLIPDESQMYATEGPYPVATLPDRREVDDLRKRANSNRGASADHMIQGTLNRIIYPTSGYTAFSFEPHEFFLPTDQEDYILLASEISFSGGYYNNEYNGSSNAVSTGAGLRIKEIRNYDTEGQFISRKKFDYGESGLLLEPVHFWRIETQVQVNDDGGLNEWDYFDEQNTYYYKTWTANSSSHSQSFAIPNAVGYSHVDVLDSDSETDKADEKINGKTTYRFHNYETVYNRQLARVSVGYLDSRNGLPSSIEYFDENGTSIKKTAYEYEKVGSSLFLSMAAKHPGTSSAPGFNVFKIEYSPMKAEWWKEKSVIEREDDIETTTAFRYSAENNARLRSQTTTRSDDKDIEITYFYAQDDPEEIQTSAQALDRMISANMVEVPLRTEQRVDGELTEGSIINYGEDLYPSSAFKWQTTSFTKEQEFNYDQGRLLNYEGRDEVDISYLWGYNNTLPIAKVVNAEHAVGISSTVDNVNRTFEYISNENQNDAITINERQDISISYNFIKTDPASTETPSLLFSIGNYDSQTIVIPAEEEGVEGSVVIPSVPKGTYDFTVHQDANTEAEGEVYYYEKTERQVFERVSEIYHQNFEEYATAAQSDDAHTGNYMYFDAYQVELRDKKEGAYLLSYWNNNGSGWSRHEEIINISSSSVSHTIDVPGAIDDICLHPVDAQMTTYTHEPLVGLSSQIDPAGIATYYQYDDLGRLECLKDEDGNVLKKYEYHFAVQK